MISNLFLSFLFVSNLLKIIPIVEAQTIDASAQPTFGNIDVGNGSTVTASMLLRTDKTSVTVGEKFKVTVAIKTDTVTINEYHIVIDFDSVKLQVVDEDPDTQGTQVKLLDTIFEVQDPATDNTVSQSGRITLIAKVPSGNPFQVNRDVAEINFQAQATGTPIIKIFSDVNGSRLIRQSGVGVSFTPNQISVQVKSATASGGTTGTNPPPSSQGTGGTTGVSQIPNTGITDDVGSAITVIIALLLIFVGVKLRMEKHKKNDL